MGSRNPLNVEVLRGNVVESSHHVMAVVADDKGQILTSWGNLNFLTMPRSAIKMLQALPLIESGAADKWDLNDKQICLACASHHGQKEHLAVLREWMAKANISESQLVCGAHLPSDIASANEVICQKTSPSVLMNNCSGKHVGLVTVAMHLGEKITGYENYESPTQKRLRKVLSETMRIDHSKLPFGVDGCGILTYAVPLQNLAIGLSSLISSREGEIRKAAAKRILKAVKAEPFYLAGTDDFCTVANKHTQGRTILKVGAEGVYAGILPEKGLVFAVKSTDGSKRAAELVAARLAKNYGGFTDAEFDELKKFTRPIITNWKGLEVGKLRLEAATGLESK
jgi:L-asparaginase II